MAWELEEKIEAVDNISIDAIAEEYKIFGYGDVVKNRMTLIGEIMQALMLAAGMGKRLGKYTQGNTKCMLEVAGKKLIDRAIDAIKRAKIKKLILVIGYKGKALQDYIESNYANGEIEFAFIYNNDYSSTNNIYSLYLAKDEMIKDDTILLESDLIYDDNIIKRIIADKRPDLVAVAKYKEWMDGTVVRLNKDASIKEMISKRNMLNELIDEYYKTVNIYKFSKDFSNNVYIPFLETYQKVVGKNSYYESVLSCLLNIGSIKLQAFNMSEIDWYEIDDEQDLDIADTMFSKGIDKYNKLLSKWGGYWRYGILDAALLVNPYFPTKEMNEKIVRNYETLLTQYPSCLSIQNLNAARVFDVDKEKIIVGNGASELIYALGRVFENKKVAVCSPVFNEYLRCFSKSKITVINNRKTNFEFNYDAFIDVLYSVDCVSIVSPDNPTGIHIERAKMIDMLSKAKEKNVKIILDESFIDFADQNERQSFISNEILDNFDNLIVVKSISKSHGNPGIRLGVLATSDVKLIKSLEKNISIWNINSFAEYYLQIFNLYKKEYYESCNKIAIERNRISKKYSYYKNLRVYKSQANYILLEFLEHNSKQIALKMLENDNILIKDLSPKDAFKGINCVRIAVKSREENDLIMNAILKYTNNINNETI